MSFPSRVRFAIESEENDSASQHTPIEMVHADLALTDAQVGMIDTWCKARHPALATAWRSVLQGGP